MVRRIWAATSAAILVLAACGGDDDSNDVAVEDADTTSATDASADDNGSDDGGGGGGPTTLDELALTTDPSSAYAESDSGRWDYNAAGSLNYNCTITPQQILVSFQTPEGQDLSIQAGNDGTGWSGQVTFAAADAEQVQYSVALGQNGGTLGVVDSALSFQGTADKIVDFDLANSEEVDVAIAVNCAPAGDGSEPTAEIGGQTYVVPFSGAQSVTCDVSPTDVDVTVNRLALENLQLAIDMRGGPDDWIGSVFVITPDGDYTVTLSGAAEGLVIDGSTVTYEGPITGDDDVEVPASVSITCP